MKPSTSLAPQNATNHNHAQKFPISLSVLRLVAQTGLHPLWKALLWISVTILLQQLSPSGSGVGYSQTPCSEWFKETCAVLHWIMVESREAHVPREWLLHTSSREAEVYGSAFLVTVQLSSKHLP